MASLNIILATPDERSKSRENTQNGDGKGDSQYRRLNYMLRWSLGEQREWGRSNIPSDYWELKKPNKLQS